MSKSSKPNPKPKHGFIVRFKGLPREGFALARIVIHSDGLPEFHFRKASRVPTITDGLVATMMRLASEKARPNFCYVAIPQGHPFHGRQFKNYDPQWLRGTELGEILAELDWIMKCLHIGIRSNDTKTRFWLWEQNSKLKGLASRTDFPIDQLSGKIEMTCISVKVARDAKELVFVDEPKIRIKDECSKAYSKYITEHFDSVAYHDEPRLFHMKEIIKLIVAAEWLTEKGVMADENWIKNHTVPKYQSVPISVKITEEQLEFMKKYAKSAVKCLKDVDETQTSLDELMSLIFQKFIEEHHEELKFLHSTEPNASSSLAMDCMNYISYLKPCDEHSIDQSVEIPNSKADTIFECKEQTTPATSCVLPNKPIHICCEKPNKVKDESKSNDSLITIWNQCSEKDVARCLEKLFYIISKIVAKVESVSIETSTSFFKVRALSRISIPNDSVNIESIYKCSTDDLDSLYSEFFPTDELLPFKGSWNQLYNETVPWPRRWDKDEAVTTYQGGISTKTIPVLPVIPALATVAGIAHVAGIVASTIGKGYREINDSRKFDEEVSFKSQLASNFAFSEEECHSYEGDNNDIDDYSTDRANAGEPLSLQTDECPVVKANPPEPSSLQTEDSPVVSANTAKQPSSQTDNCPVISANAKELPSLQTENSQVVSSNAAERPSSQIDDSSVVKANPAEPPSSQTDAGSVVRENPAEPASLQTDDSSVVRANPAEQLSLQTDEGSVVRANPAEPPSLQTDKSSVVRANPAGPPSSQTNDGSEVRANPAESLSLQTDVSSAVRAEPQSQTDDSSVVRANPAEPPPLQTDDGSVVRANPAETLPSRTYDGSVVRTNPAEPPSVQTDDGSVVRANPAEPPSLQTDVSSVVRANPAEPPLLQTDDSSVDKGNPAEPPSFQTDDSSVVRANPAEPASSQTDDSSVDKGNPAEPPSLQTDDSSVVRANAAESPPSKTDDGSVVRANPAEPPSSQTDDSSVVRANNSETNAAMGTDMYSIQGKPLFSCTVEMNSCRSIGTLEVQANNDQLDAKQAAMENEIQPSYSKSTLAQFMDGVPTNDVSISSNSKHPKTHSTVIGYKDPHALIMCDSNGNVLRQQSTIKVLEKTIVSNGNAPICVSVCQQSIPFGDDNHGSEQWEIGLPMQTEFVMMTPISYVHKV